MKKWNFQGSSTLLFSQGLLFIDLSPTHITQLYFSYSRLFMLLKNFSEPCLHIFYTFYFYLSCIFPYLEVTQNRITILSGNRQNNKKHYLFSQYSYPRWFIVILCYLCCLFIFSWCYLWYLSSKCDCSQPLPTKNLSVLGKILWLQKCGIKLHLVSIFFPPLSLLISNSLVVNNLVN